MMMKNEIHPNSRRKKSNERSGEPMCVWFDKTQKPMPKKKHDYSYTTQPSKSKRKIERDQKKMNKWFVSRHRESQRKKKTENKNNFFFGPETSSTQKEMNLLLL